MVLNYYSKDLSLNPTRFDSWATLALFTKEDILDDYFEMVISILNLLIYIDKKIFK